MENSKVVICKICNQNNNDVKFEIGRRVCVQCRSKQALESMKQRKPEYFKNYYLSHSKKDHPLKPGRPKKVVENQVLNPEN